MIENDLIYFLIYFLYGLAFFSMGIAIVVEGNKSADERLRLSLRPLAGFGLIHGCHEWLEMTEHAGLILPSKEIELLWSGLKISCLAFSFISLAAFGFSLLNPNIKIRRLALLGPLVLAAIWGFGVFSLSSTFNLLSERLIIVDVWSRYSLGVPAAILAAIGLVVQQRTFRQAGMAKFGRDALIASVAFGWYGVVGQLITQKSRLWPSTVMNEEMFFDWFGIPVQLFRTLMAVIVSVSVIRFMQAFETETKEQIKALQEYRVREAQKGEALKAELFKRVISAQEAERQRIARELHDETGQTLTAIGLGLRGVSSEISKDPRKAQQTLGKLEGLTSESIDELQRMISNLRPAHLDDLGLASAIRWYLGKNKVHTGLNYSFRVVGEERELTDPLSTAIYRMTQEAITNTIKHASASKVDILLEYLENEIVLTVTDDGRGMIVKDSPNSWGLLGMRERAALFDGKFFIHSSPGKGVQITARIPYDIEGSAIEMQLQNENNVEEASND